MMSCASVRLMTALVVLVGTISTLDASQSKDAGHPREDRQNRPSRLPPWWKNEQIVKDLRLTPKQVEKIDGIYNAARPEIMEHNLALSEHEAALSRLIKDSVSEAKVLVQIGMVESTRARLATARQLMLYRFRSVLTPDQRVKFDVLHPEWVKNIERQRAEQNKKPG
jgi:Spy/CpxP family protein refolding chaperone